MFSMLLIGSTVAMSQSLEDIGNLMEKSRFADAKNAIDKYLADPKNGQSSEGWYYKGRIYNSLSRDAQTPKANMFALRIGSYDAFRKHQELDKLGIRMKAEEYRSYLDLYSGFYDLGAYQFNEKDFAGAYKSFSKAQDVENFIISKNYTYDDFKLSKIDTVLISNTALSALNSMDTVNAVMNYRKLTDAGIRGADQERIYEYLVSYYANKKDEGNLQPLLDKAKAAYPKNNFWNEVEMDRLMNSGDKKGMFAKYEELYAKDPANYGNNYNYAIELYNTLYKDKVNDPVVKEKLTSLLKNTIPLDTGIDAAMLMTNHLFNSFADHNNAAVLVKGTKPEDVKKKKEHNTLAYAKMDEAVPYADRVIKYFSGLSKLTTKQKVNYENVAGYMSDMYGARGNAKKVAEYDKIRSSIKF